VCRLLGVVVVVLPCDWVWLVAGTFVALLVLWFFGYVVCWQRDVRVSVGVGGCWECSGWERSGREVRSAAADLRSEGNGDMSGWWRWWMGDAGGGEEGQADEGD
jgi:hypothetical protein